MRFLLICFVFSLSETLILDFLADSFVETGRCRLRVWLFVSLFILSALKLIIAGNRLATGVFPLVAFLALYLSLKHAGGLLTSQIIKVFLANIVISFGGEMIVTFVFSNLVQEIIYSYWDFSYATTIVVLSNFLQIMAAFIVKKSRESIGDPIGQKQKDTEQMSKLIMLFQFVILGACLFYEIDKYRNMHVTFLLIGQQICSSIAGVYLILKNFRDDDVKRLQNHLKILEEQNQLVYQYYQDMEEYEQNLYRVRHDFNNLMYAACVLANNGEFETAEEMINEMEKMAGRNTESRQSYDKME